MPIKRVDSYRTNTLGLGVGDRFFPPTPAPWRKWGFGGNAPMFFSSFFLGGFGGVPPMVFRHSFLGGLGGFPPWFFVILFFGFFRRLQDTRRGKKTKKT